MTDQVAPSAATPSAEPRETPVPEIGSAPSGASPSVDVDAITDEVERRLTPRMQSRTDTWVAGRLRGTSTEALAKRLGVPVEKVEQVQRDMVIDEVVAERLATPSEVQPPQPKETLADRTGTLLGRLIRELGVDFTPSELEVLKGKRTYFSEQDWLDTVEADVRKKAKQAAPGASAALPEGGGGPPPNPDLRKQYNDRLAKIRRGDVRSITSLKNEFRKRGLTDV